MNLNPATDGTKLDTLKAWLVNNGFGAEGTDSEALAAINAQASPNFYIYNHNVSVKAVKEAISWKKLTSAAGIPALTGTNATDQTNMLHMLAKHTSCQGLVLNLQTILGLSSDGSLDATSSVIRQGLKDALEAVPSLANGTTQDAGWAGVEPLLARLATVGEKLFASGGGDGSTPVLARNNGVNAADEPLRGQIDAQNISDARARP